MNYFDLIGALMVLLGAIVLLVAAIGLLRMPDSYNRIQVGTKASTAGVALVMLGLAVIIPEWFGKLFTILLFVMLTNPVSSHVLMRAAHKAGQPLTDKTIIDKLKEDEDKNNSHDNI
ncbi:MAG: Na+/H+ antiporter subunit G [Bacteroidales bacterium]|jgi:multicomponent Na+:H+ antiporter subunit G|nr:Na+/H+ antiporter subunit G [Bacteroidales bacterium]